MYSLYLTISFFFFFNDTATTEIYTLSLHDALPISQRREPHAFRGQLASGQLAGEAKAHDLVSGQRPDRKSTRLNSSHSQISYAVFCLKKKNKHQRTNTQRDHGLLHR